MIGNSDYASRSVMERFQTRLIHLFDDLREHLIEVEVVEEKRVTKGDIEQILLLILPNLVELMDEILDAAAKYSRVIR